MTHLEEKKGIHEVLSKEFDANTLDKISAHVKLDFAKENIPNEFLIIATICDTTDCFEGIIIEKSSLSSLRKNGTLHLKTTKTDAKLITKNAYTWQFREGICTLYITTSS